MKVRLNTGGKYLIVIVLGIIAAFVWEFHKRQ